MRDQNSVKLDIDTTVALKSIVQTYEEIAVMKIQKIRTDVLTTRDFLKRLNEVYAEVKKSYKNNILKMIQKSKDNEKFTFSTLQKNGKKVKVLLTANERLVGDIPMKVFNRFFSEFISERCDIIIVGKVGRQLFDDQGAAVRYQYFDLPSHNADLSELKPIISQIIKYEKVDVYHGRLINLVTQLEDKTNLSGEEVAELKPNDSQKTEDFSDYLFEPNIKKVLNFFEVQIFGSLFRQSIDEANLANLGSRIKAMEQATTNTEERLEKLKFELIRVQKSVDNKKQLQRLAGISIWK